MTAKERIMTIRLVEKAEKHPEFAKKLVIEAASKKAYAQRILTRGPHKNVRPLRLSGREIAYDLL